MKFSIEAKDGYLRAALQGRDTAEEMREFLLAVHAACQKHGTPKILISVRQSRAVFKPEDYGLDGSMPGYARELATTACQVALVGDTAELHSAHEYIEVVARQQNLNVRAFRAESAALRWMDGGAATSRRYPFTRIVISGSPEEAGVYALWDGEELVYYGRAEGGVGIRSALLDHYYREQLRPTHYSWEVCKDPAAREAELLAEHRRVFGRPPRLNAAA
jgi:hypothetical protein